MRRGRRRREGCRGASDSFSYGMAAPAPAAKTVSFQEDGLDDDSEDEEESEEEDEDFVKRDPDDTEGTKIRSSESRSWARW